MTHPTLTRDTPPTTFGRKLLIVIGVIAVLLIGAWGLYGDHTTPPRFSVEQFRGKDLQQAASAIAKATVEGGAPGVVILIRQNGTEYIASAGVANKQTQQAMPTQAPLRIGSVSKVYTATVILALADQGLLSLDDPIQNHLPADLIHGLQNADIATVRQLLNHTAGIPDYYDVRSYLTQDWTQPITLQRTLPVAKRGAVDFRAGEQRQYSNMGYILLGEIAEKVSGQSFQELINQLITQPLGLSNTYYNMQHPTGSNIHGYGTVLRPWADTYPLWEHSGPDGGIVATASETARFIEALTLDNGKLSTIGTQMLATMVPAQGQEEQGLGLISITSKAEDRLIGHTGDVFGYQTIAFAWPESNAVFVAQLNCDCASLTYSVLRNTYQAIKATLNDTSRD